MKRSFTYIRLCLLAALLTGAVSAGARSRITVYTSVTGADWMIDEGDVCAVGGKQASAEVVPGFHSVTVMKMGYRPYVDTVTIADGVNQEIDVWLEPLTEGKVSDFKRLSWAYQITNRPFRIRWFAMGGGILTGVTAHVSLFDMRYGLLGIEPCTWGFNYPFFANVAHTQRPWLVHDHSRRVRDYVYDVSIPYAEIQLFYTPQISVHLPMSSNCAVVLSAGPQVSWTYIHRDEQRRELPISYAYQFVRGEFPDSGFELDKVWFTLQAGLIFTGQGSDFMPYVRYQDGFFAGAEIRF